MKSGALTMTGRRVDPTGAGIAIMAALSVSLGGLWFGVHPIANVLLSFLTGLGVWSNIRVLTGSRYLLVYAAVLAGKIALLLYQIQYRNLPLSGVDWGYYHTFGYRLAEEMEGRYLDIITFSDYDLFTRVTAVWYTAFGVQSEQMYFLVFVTSLATFTYIFGAAAILLGNTVRAQQVAMLFMMWPIEIVHSITFLREMPMQLLIAASLYHFLRYWRDRKSLHMLLAIALSLSATLMHSGVIALPISYLYLGIRAKGRGGIQIVRTVLFVIAIWLLLQTTIAAPLLAKFGDFETASAIFDPNTAAPTVTFSDATTNYVNADTSDAPLYQLPYRIVLFALSPLPWQATSLGTGVAVLIEGLPRLLVVALLISAFWRSRTGDPRHDIVPLVLLLTILVTYATFSLGVSNYGTAMRHRAKLFPLEIILAFGAATVWRRTSVAVLGPTQRVARGFRVRREHGSRLRSSKQFTHARREEE